MQWILLAGDIFGFVPPVVTDFLIPGLVGGMVLTYIVYGLLKEWGYISI